MSEHYRDFKLRREGPVAILTICRPQKLNAVTADSIHEMETALDALDRDEDIRAVIVTGEGRAFCAGADISQGFEVPKTGDPATGEGILSDPGGRVTLRIFRMAKPVIGAVNGAAIGFGSSVLLPMDHRIAVPAAKFAFPFTKRAIVAESCSSWFLPRLVGMPTALSWMMSGRTFGCDEALRAGMIQEIAEPEMLLTRAMEIAHMFIDDTSASSVALVRQLLWRMLGENHPMSAHRLESRGLVAAYRGPDYEEGYRSFLEKRPPRFTSQPLTDTEFASEWWPEPRF